MLTSVEYIRQSVETNLFFLRIMKEHLIFAASALTLKDEGLVPKLLELKERFERLLEETIILAKGTVDPKTISAGDIVTQYTYKAELKTMEYTGLAINTEITLQEIRLLNYPGTAGRYSREHSVDMLNKRIIALLETAVKSQKEILQKVLDCEVFTYIYPLLLDHITREAGEYLRHLQSLQKREDIRSEAGQTAKQVAFWNDIMGEHAKFMRGMFDPAEVELIRVANGFSDEFDELTAVAVEAYQKPEQLPRIIRESLTATTNIRNFKEQGTEGILACKIRSVILPLLGDHVLREANHYLQQLKNV